MWVMFLFTDSGLCFVSELEYCRGGVMFCLLTVCHTLFQSIVEEVPCFCLLTCGLCFVSECRRGSAMLCLLTVCHVLFQSVVEEEPCFVY